MKSIWQKYMFAFIATPISLTFCVITWFYNKPLAVAELVLLIAVCFAYILHTYVENIKVVSKIKGVATELNTETGSTLDSVPFLCAAFDESGDIFWFNDKFSDSFFAEGKSHSVNITQVLGVDNLEKLLNSDSVIKHENGRQYICYSREYRDKSDKLLHILYMIDDTENMDIKERYLNTRPSIILINVDTLDDIRQNFKESECGAIFGRIEEIVIKWADKFNSVCRRLSTGKFLVIAEEENLKAMIEDKFKLLEYVRNLSYAEKKINATLSIGIGKEENLIDSNEAAKAAIDMAQGRGGDQVAIKEHSDYTFFGGVSAGPERSNKVKTRVVATSFKELIENCENVMIMGHRYADLDAFGSAMGVLSIVRHLKKPVSIVIDKQTALAKPLIKKFEDAGNESYLVSVDKSKYMVTENTLLVVVDTHKPDFTECPELLKKAGRIVVIDHHRKSVNHIENAVLFFHASYASSASEMVTELAQYIGDTSIIDSLTAQALLSGIVLDTRNFILRTGVRTFEAAAYLRSRAADTVEVKKLFSNDMELFKYRNMVVDNAFNYKGCAISVADIQSDDIRLITSQAADELLNIDGVKASFVIFEMDGVVNISTRSFGEMNVQVVMEKFGGGGHQTMAAAQIDGGDIDDIVDMLKEEIDNYFDET